MKVMLEAMDLTDGVDLVDTVRFRWEGAGRVYEELSVYNVRL
jgi:hypothetical protein